MRHSYRVLGGIVAAAWAVRTAQAQYLQMEVIADASIQYRIDGSSRQGSGKG